jgi:DNA replication protein DnaC
MRSDCERCNGTGWLVRPVQDGAARAVAERCSCVLEQAGRQKLLLAQIPRKFAAAGFDGFTTEEKSLREAKAACQRLVARYPDVQRGLLLMGSSGIGKTHLAVATLRGLLQKDADGLFYDFRDLLDELRASYGSESQRSEEAILHRVFTVEVLVLDEIGSEKLTDWVREIVHRVIIRRYNDERLTICTTNYLDADLLGKEADPLETLEGRIGARLRSRLYEMCETLILGGRDYRRQHGTLDRARAAQASAASRSEPAEQLFSLEQCRRSFERLPEAEKEKYRTQVREKTPGLTGRAIDEKAIELLREELVQG